MISPGLVWPRGVSREDFLANVWQCRVLKMPAALPGFHSPLSPDELAGLACDDTVESRLVLHRAGAWTLRTGPFSEQDMRELANTDWTLLVQDVEKHLPELARILDPFRFLPSWRLDDLMVSCAAPGGSVGPHVDAYDVFLVQAQGCRRWQWSLAKQDYRIRTDSELCLVEDFVPDEEWVAKPGDVLYLPPGVPHFGTALPDDDLCMTYSIGFRAPSRSEMLQDLALYLADHSDPRYADQGLDPTESTDGIISGAAVNRVRGLLNQALALDDQALARWFGSLVTEPKAWLKPLPNDEPICTGDLIDALERGARLRRHGMALWARWQDRDTLLMFVDGRALEPGAELAPLVQQLCGHQELDIPPSALRATPGAARLVTELVNAGELEIEYEQ